MRILFVVCGEGLGHSSRCIDLGHYLEQHGHSVIFLAYGKSYDFFHDHGCTTVYKGQREVCLEGENGFFSLKKTLWCSRWVFLNMVRSALIVRRLITEQRIDCVVCDTMYGGVLAARFRKCAGSLYHQPEPVQRTRGPEKPCLGGSQLPHTALPAAGRYGYHPRLPAPGYRERIQPPDPGAGTAALSFHRAIPRCRSLTVPLRAENDLYQFRGRALQTPALPVCSGRSLTGGKIWSSMYSILVPSFPNRPIIISPTGMCPTCMNTSPRRGSRSCMAD